MNHKALSRLLDVAFPGGGISSLAHLPSTPLGLAVTGAVTGAGFWRFDIEHEHLWTSARCRALFGVRKHGAASELDFLAALHADDHAPVARLLEKLRVGEETLAAITFRVRLGSHTRWCLAIACVDLDKHGAAKTISGMVQDITKRRAIHTGADLAFETFLEMRGADRLRTSDDFNEAATQTLVGLRLLLGNLALPPAAPEDFAETIEIMQASVQSATNNLLTNLHLLKTTRLGTGSFRDNLERYLAGFPPAAGKSIALRCNPLAAAEGTMPRLAFFTLIQECLTAIWRRLPASALRIDVRSIGPRLHLVIRCADWRRDTTLAFISDTAALIVRAMGGVVANSSRLPGVIFHASFPQPPSPPQA